MRNLLNFGVDAPLALEMAHPIETRLKTLQYADRERRALPLAIGSLLLAASVMSPVSAKTVDRVEVAPASIAQSVTPVHSDSETMPLPEKAALPLRIAEAVSISVTSPQRLTKLKPMRLRMNPHFTTDQLNTFTAARKRLVEIDPSAAAAFNGDYINISYYNRFEVVVKDNGQALMNISRGTGGWPGQPVINTQWDTRPLSAEMQAGMRAALDKCASRSEPFYFHAAILDGDPDMGRGNFEIECTPGSEVKQARLSNRDLAQAWLRSDDIRLDRRQSNMDWKMSFALIEEHVAKTNGASLAADRIACVEINETIRDEYSFSDSDRAARDKSISECGEVDYNWVRRRMNVPEVQ